MIQMQANAPYMTWVTRSIIEYDGIALDKIIYHDISPPKVIVRANPPVRPHNFLGILKESIQTPVKLYIQLGRSTRVLGI